MTFLLFIPPFGNGKSAPLFPGGSVKNPPAMQETQETPPRSLGQEAPWRREWWLCRWSCSWGQLSCCPRRPHCSLIPGQARCELRGGKGTRGALGTADTVILAWLISRHRGRCAVFSPLAVTQPTRRNTSVRRQVCLRGAHECPPRKAATAQARPGGHAQYCKALSRHIIYQRGAREPDHATLRSSLSPLPAPVSSPGKSCAGRNLVGYIHGVARVRRYWVTRPPLPSRNKSTFGEAVGSALHANRPERRPPHLCVR